MTGPKAFETYADDAYGFRLAYPADWLVETEPAGGASFTDPRSSAGATVSIDEDLDLTLADYVAAFLKSLAVDEHVRVLEALDRRDVALEGGGTGRAIEYSYLSDGERWRLTYLFVRAGERGYVLGVDWNDDNDLDDLAAWIVESFAVETTD
ncbi:hypothetical protein C492_07330 [Natronococcus jeotgali DSM 18795]|uniref:Uncharacterized protein n=1 Tax=Natronococcus jeotgali DSM 18795 TaxID=1227498 RepID=L9XP56_9EURY|nr:hypothetical protein C492_07330 [Natronococcus jeotgali DSM 18795]